MPVSTSPTDPLIVLTAFQAGREPAPISSTLAGQPASQPLNTGFQNIIPARPKPTPVTRSWTACLGESGGPEAAGLAAARSGRRVLGWREVQGRRGHQVTMSDERWDEPLPGGGPLPSIRRRDPLEIQAWKMGHADGHVTSLQGREEFLARPQCALGLGLGKE